MTSKISSIKLIKENIRQRGWLAALSFILLFLSETIYSIMAMEQTLNASYGLIDPDSFTWQFLGYLNGRSNIFLIAVLFLIAILCGVTGYAYLHSTERTDFFHSLPLTRKQWFLISYIGGLVIYVIPYLLSCLFTIVFGACKGLLTAELLLACPRSILSGIFMFLICYHITIFAMMLTGKLVTGVLASLVLMVYTLMIRTLFSGLIGYFFETYYGEVQTDTDKLWLYLSPVTLFSRWDFAGMLKDSFIYLLPCTLLVLLLLFFGAYGLYRIRPSEAAGCALAFPTMASAVKVLIAIPSALYAGIFAVSIFGNSSTKWCFIISILSVILLCGIIEFIYQQDLRLLLKRKCSSLISIAGVIGILCILQFDLFGYDSWIPEKGDLKSMSFHSSVMNNYFFYPYTVNLSTPDLLSKTRSTDFDTIYQLAEEGIANTKDGITPDTLSDFRHKQGYVPVTIAYQRKNGKTTYRSYCVKRDTALQALSDTCKNENFRRALFPAFYLDSIEITEIGLNDIYCQTTNLQLSKSQQDALLEAYQEDVLAVDISSLEQQAPIGELVINYNDPANTGDPADTSILSQLYIYDNYDNTRALLNEYGYSLQIEIDPDDTVYIKQLTFEDTAYIPSSDGTQIIADKDFENGISITDAEDKIHLLSQVHYPCSGILGGLDTTSGYIEVLLKGSSSPTNYPLW